MDERPGDACDSVRRLRRIEDDEIRTLVQAVVSKLRDDDDEAKKNEHVWMLWNMSEVPVVQNELGVASGVLPLLVQYAVSAMRRLATSDGDGDGDGKSAYNAVENSLLLIHRVLNSAGVDAEKLRPLVRQIAVPEFVVAILDSDVLRAFRSKSEVFEAVIELLGRIGEFGEIDAPVYAEIASRYKLLLGLEIPELPLCRLFLGTLLRHKAFVPVLSGDESVVALMVRIMRSNGPPSGVLRSTITDRSARLAFLTVMLATIILLEIGYFDDPSSSTREDWVYLRQVALDFIDTPEKHDRETRFAVQAKILDLFIRASLSPASSVSFHSRNLAMQPGVQTFLETGTLPNPRFT